MNRSQSSDEMDSKLHLLTMQHEFKLKLLLTIFRCLLIFILLVSSLFCISYGLGPAELWSIIIGNCCGYTFSSRLKGKGRKLENIASDEIDGVKTVALRR